MVTVVRAILICANIFSYALIARAIGSWFIGAFRNTPLAKVYDFLCAFTEPVVSPVRNFMYSHVNTGMFDFSILVTMILVELVARVAVRLLIMFI